MSMERLEALQGMTDEVDAMNPSPEAAAAAAAQADAANAQDAGAKAWGGVMFIVGGAVCMLAPELNKVYTEAACLAWGKNAQAVSDKRGWGSPTSNLPEISLLASTLMMLVPTVLVLRAKMQEAEKNDPEGVVAKVQLWWRARRAKKGLASAAGRAASGGK